MHSRAHAHTCTHTRAFTRTHTLLSHTPIPSRTITAKINHSSESICIFCSMCINKGSSNTPASEDSGKKPILDQCHRYITKLQPKGGEKAVMDYFCQFFPHGLKSRPGIVPAEFFCQFLFREKSPSEEKKSLFGRKLALIAGLKCVDADRPSLGESTSKPNPPPPGKNGQNIFLLLFLFQTLCIILRSWSFKDFPC